MSRNAEMQKTMNKGMLGLIVLVVGKVVRLLVSDMVLDAHQLSHLKSSTYLTPHPRIILTFQSSQRINDDHTAQNYVDLPNSQDYATSPALLQSLFS